MAQTRKTKRGRPPALSDGAKDLAIFALGHKLDPHEIADALDVSSTTIWRLNERLQSSSEPGCQRLLQRIYEHVQQKDVSNLHNSDDGIALDSV